jgi:hypothetical protein
VVNFDTKMHCMRIFQRQDTTKSIHLPQAEKR